SAANVSLLMVAAFVMILPSPYASSTQYNNGIGKQNDELMVSRAAACILLMMYGCLLVFVLVTHKDLMDVDSSSSDLNKQIKKLSDDNVFMKNNDILLDSYHKSDLNVSLKPNNDNNINKEQNNENQIIGENYNLGDNHNNNINLQQIQSIEQN